MRGPRLVAPTAFVLAVLALCAGLVWLSTSCSARTPVSAQLIDDYLRRQGSPMAGEGAHYLKWGERWNIDPRVVVAISGAESSFGKDLCGPYNAWGWKYPTGDTCWQGFRSGPDPDTARYEGYVVNMETGWEDGIYWLSRQIRLYIDRGLTSIYTIRPVYCKSGCENWLRNVESFLLALGGDPYDLTWPGRDGEPIPVAGSIRVTTTPSGAPVAIEGQGGSRTSPAQWDGLPSGRTYRIIFGDIGPGWAAPPPRETSVEPGRTIEVHADYTDVADPTVSILFDISPNPTGWFTSSPKAWVRAEDQGSGVASAELLVDGAVVGTETTLSDGSHTLEARATDRAGRQAKPAVAQAKVDTKPPTVRLAVSPSAPNPQGWYTIQPTVTVAADDAVSGISLKEVLVDGQSRGPEASIGSGRHSVQARARDNAGLEAVSDILMVNVDTIPPVITVPDQPIQSPNLDVLTFAWDGMDMESGIAGYRYRWQLAERALPGDGVNEPGQGVWSEMIEGTSGWYRLERPLFEGQMYVLEVTATDAAGNGSGPKHVYVQVRSPEHQQPWTVLDAGGGAEVKASESYRAEDSLGQAFGGVAFGAEHELLQGWYSSMLPEGMPNRAGDLDGDGRVKVADAVKCLRYAVGLVELSEEEKEAADVAPAPGTGGRQYGDGQVAMNDVTRLLKRALGIIREWPGY